MWCVLGTFWNVNPFLGAPYYFWSPENSCPRPWWPGACALLLWNGKMAKKWEKVVEKQLEETEMCVVRNNVVDMAKIWENTAMSGENGPQWMW